MWSLLGVLLVAGWKCTSAMMDFRDFASSPPPPLAGFIDPGIPPPSLLYALGQYAPPYDLSVETLEPFPGCNAYHSTLCAVQHAIRLVTQVREEACPSIESGGAERDAALANITQGAYTVPGTKGFGVYVVSDSGIILADHLFPHLVGLQVDGISHSGLVAQPTLLGYIEWVTRHGGGFVPHFTTRVSKDGDMSTPLSTSTYFEKCSTGERIGVAIGREPFPEIVPCSFQSNSFCALQNARRVIGKLIVDFLNMHDGGEFATRWYDVNYGEAYSAANKEFAGSESLLSWFGYPGLNATYNEPPLPNNPGTTLANGGGTSSMQLFVGHHIIDAFSMLGAPALGELIAGPLESAAWTGGAWQDHYSPLGIGYRLVAFSAGAVHNNTPYRLVCTLVHSPEAPVSGPSCQDCSAEISWPCSYFTSMRLLAHAYTEYLTPLGSWDTLSSDPWFGSDSASARAAIAGGATRNWPAGFHVIAFSWDGECYAHGGQEELVGKDASEVFGDNTTHELCKAAANTGGGSVRRVDSDGNVALILVRKAAKAGQWYYMGVEVQQAWAPWNADCSSSYASPCAEANAQALLGMASAVILGAKDEEELLLELASIVNRTGSFSPEQTGDFFVHVITQELACLPGVACQASQWPSYWQNLIKESASARETSWVPLLAIDTFKASQALIMPFTWQELDGTSTFDLMLVTFVVDAEALPSCSIESDCPADAVCVERSCQCIGTHLALTTKDNTSCSALPSSSLTCVDVAGKLCEGGTNCRPCPGGYSCMGGSAYLCTRGMICPEGALSAQYCPAGTMGTAPMATNSSSCRECDAGTYSSQLGATTCEECEPGTAASLEGSTTCARCDIGYYSEQSGQTTCTPCPSGFTTEFRGATKATDCVCPPSMYLTLAGGSCMACPEGLECLQANSTEAAIFLATEDDWPSPQPKSGYMVLTSYPLGAYLCQEPAWCPGGPPGTCAANRDQTSVGCAQCLDGHTSMGDGTCSKCVPGQANFLVGSASVVALICLGIATRAANRNQLSQPSNIATVVITLGLTVSAIQTLGIFGTISVRWLEPVSSILPVLKVASFDLKMLEVGCLVGSKSVVNSILRQGVAPFAALYVTFVVALQKVLYQPSMDFGICATNTVGSIYQLFFVSIFVTQLMPLVCYKHPGSMGYSMVTDPAVLCTNTGEHLDLVVVSLCSVLLVTVPYLTVISFAVVRYRAAMASNQLSHQHLRRFQFLFNRYNPECYWYGGVALLKNTAICLAPVIFRDVKSMQLLGVCVTLLSTCAFQMHMRPWRSALANTADAGINLLLVLMLVCVAMSTDYSGSDSVLGILSAVMFVLVVGGPSAVVLRSAFKHCIPTPYYDRFLCHHKADAAAQARFLQLLFQRRTNKLCFIDSDHLTGLEELFDIVRTRCGNLTVYLTADTLKRPWCAGEVAVSCQTHQRASTIQHPSFAKLSEEELEDIGSYVAAADFNLVEYGITMEAISNAYRWLLSNMSANYHLDCVLAGPRKFEAVVDQVLRADHSSSRTSEDSESTKNKPDCLMVSSALGNDDEANAAVGILVGIIETEVTKVVPNGFLIQADLHEPSSEEVSKMVQRSRAVIVILSSRTLSSKQQLNVMCGVAGSEVPFIPVCLPNFRYPTGPVLEDLLGKMGDKASEIGPRLSLFFKVISVRSPLVSVVFSLASRGGSKFISTPC